MPALLDIIAASAVLPISAGAYLLGRRCASTGALTPASGGGTPLGSSPGVGAVAEPGPTSGVSDEAMRLLRLLRSAWLLVDRSDCVVGQSADVEALGLVRENVLLHEELREIVRLARRENRVVECDLDVARGPMEDARIDLGVRAAPLAPDVIVLVVEDRTQARRIEETRRDFVVNVSHELKTPVGGLRLLAEAVEEAADDPEAVARFAARMKKETVRLSSLVQEIVDLSRLQGADTVAAAKPVDLGECAVSAAEETRLLAEGRGIEITLRADEGSHVVMGDEGLLTTAIRNLVSNAVNYSTDGTRITVGVSADDDDVVVQVSDEGIGLSAVEVERVFERFYRVDPARSRQTGGTGLGLAIVKHVTANHGGRINVWSEPGVGSTFEMQFPARNVAAFGDVEPPLVSRTIDQPGGAPLCPAEPKDTL